MAKQNKHLDHLEDRIILEGTKGGEDAIKLLKMMGEFLSGSSSSSLRITTKWDGAPAVICGIDPEDGRFFVGTKSVFAKDPKVCKTQQEIQQLYSGALAQKLSASLQYLPASVTSGILQGDLMFTDDKKTETIDKKRYITFRPNTITYAADPKSDVGKLIQAARIGIVFHTKYTGTSLRDLTASFNVNKSDFKTGGSVWAERAEFKNIGGAASLTPNERRQFDNYVKRAEGSLKQSRNILNKIQTGKKTLQIDTEFLKFFNGYVKEGRPIPSVKKAYEDFYKHLYKEFEKVTKKYKSSASVDKKVEQFVQLVTFIEKNQREIQMAIATYMNLQACKHIIVNKLQKVEKLRLFVNMGDHYESTTPEGFVGVVGDKATKLIDRLEFSRLNFTVPKQWD